MQTASTATDLFPLSITRGCLFGADVEPEERVFPVAGDGPLELLVVVARRRQELALCAGLHDQQLTTINSIAVLLVASKDGTS